MAKRKSKAQKEEEQADRDLEFIKTMIDAASKLPKEVYFSIMLSVAWSKTHEGHMNSGDMMLGTLGGFTLGPALQGDIMANTWAMGYLGGLGWNFVDIDPLKWLEEQIEGIVGGEIRVGSPMKDTTGPPSNVPINPLLDLSPLD